MRFKKDSIWFYGLKIVWELLYGSRLVLSKHDGHHRNLPFQQDSSVDDIRDPSKQHQLVIWGHSIHNKQKILYVVYGMIPNLTEFPSISWSLFMPFGTEFEDTFSICFCVLQQHHDLFCIDSSHSMTIEPPSWVQSSSLRTCARKAIWPSSCMAGTLVSDVKKKLVVHNG